MNGETPHLTLKYNNFKIVLTITAELTHFPKESVNNLQRVFWQEVQSTLPPPSIPGSQGAKQARSE